jgi:hypothetical protein
MQHSYSNTNPHAYSLPLLTFKIPEPKEIKDENFLCQKSSRQTNRQERRCNNASKKENKHTKNLTRLLPFAARFSSPLITGSSNTRKPKRLQIP